MPSSRQAQEAASVRSLLTVKRAGWKLGFFLLAAGAQTLVGYGLASALSLMCFMASYLCAVAGVLIGQRVAAPHFT